MICCRQVYEDIDASKQGWRVSAVIGRDFGGKALQPCLRAINLSHCSCIRGPMAFSDEEADYGARRLVELDPQ